MKLRGYKNAEKLYQRSQIYEQIKQVMALLEANPELAQATGGTPQDVEPAGGPAQQIDKAKKRVAGMQQ